MATYVIVLIFTVIALSDALESTINNEEDIKKVMELFFKKIPDVGNKYVINEDLSKTISNYFHGKVNAFPLFKINIKVDRTPVKIPWTLDQAEPPNEKPMKKKYKYIKRKQMTKSE
ncbi:uncharacterized protein LOC126777873 [Nymphalis io]|uniref:uncharacterized protein LOC126777873 n=1 Tax=Inachis io TaxID=171585 RepID=UPI00216722EE|nr:uncharacterized protein LOC126777873 [Nymphalis io]